MTKHKTLSLLWAALSLLLLFSVMPVSAQSSADNSAAPDTLFNCTWTSSTVYPQTILDQATASVGGFLYTFAGVSTAIIANSFKFDGTTWTAIAPLPVALEFPAAVSDGTNIYIVGGSDGGGVSVTTLYRYNVATNTYTTLAPCATATWNHAAVFLNGKIYKFAGSNNTVSTAALEIYDIASNTWSAGAPYPESPTVSFVSGFAVGNFIYGAGGIAASTSVPTLKTYRYDPVANSWNDAAIADLPATRWGAAAATYQDGILAGGYVGGAVTANISNTVISWDLASNAWLSVPNMIGERSRMTGAVFNNSFYVVGGRSIASSAFVGENSNQKLTCLNTPTNILSAGGSSIVNAGPNGVLDPAEVVTVSLGVQNIGGPGVVCTTPALVGTLQATGGVTSPSAPQNYGGGSGLCSGSPAVFRNFTFTVDPATPCGNTVTASLQLQDGATNYGTASYSFLTGSSAISLSENFDGVVAPALPAGWSTTFSGTGTAVTTSTISPDTAPNDIFLSEATNVGLSEVASATIAVPAGGASTLSFRNLFNTESTFDGLVLEIKIGAGAFQDILAAGGTFVSGGYNSTVSTGFSNPLPGRMAWTGLSGGTAAAPTYITTVVTLPAAASGQNIQLMWRQGSDNSVAPTNPGSRIDSISIKAPVCGGNAPIPSSAVSRKTHGAAGPFDINLPLVALSGAIGIEDRTGGGVGVHTIVVTFPNPVTVGAAAVTTGAGSATAAVAGGVVTINLTGVTNAQRLDVTLSNVSSGASLGSVRIPMGVLAGDTNGNGSVNAGDVGQTKAGAAAGIVDGTTFRTDINTSGGINASDISIVKAAAGGVLPP
jgi:Kelch motif